MSAPRLKLSIWSPTQRKWMSAMCLITMLQENLILLKAYGYLVKVNGRPEPRVVT